ncbi:MAG: alanine acetyltransferase [Chloroflexi bacterium]|jgi:ribosomal-protein-alanine N-acetyltransferase|nr:alanine acetyltransferase [Chloroflexota bacterium]
MRKLDFRLDIDNLYLRLLEEKDIPELLKLYQDNWAFLQPWEPYRPESFFTSDNFRYMVQADQAATCADEAYAFGLFLADSDRLIGRYRLSWVMRGCAETCNLGYFLAEAYNGRGYSTRAVKRIIRFAFEELGLHRVFAATMINNIASQRVLEKAGFRREGTALRFLKINNRWEDHCMFAITTEDLPQ